MKFAPEYVTHVLNENFEDAKQLLLSPLMAINYAHLVMLAEQKIISAAEARALRDALDGISLEQVRAVRYDGTYEDLFFYIERLIDQACGADVAGRLHTARSRNDLAMTMYRMRQRESIAALGEVTLKLRQALLALAERHTATIYGAHTHTQPAQPTTIAHYLLAIIEQLERDTVRLAAAFESTNHNPLGACAITGTGFPIAAISTVASNLVVLTCFTICVAWVRSYNLVPSNFSTAALRFLVRVAMMGPWLFGKRAVAANNDAHAAGRSGHHAHGTFDVEAIQVGHLVLGDGLDLLPGHGAHFLGLGHAATAFHLGRVHQLNSCGRGLDDEVEALIGVYRDHHGQHLACLVLRARIELLAEFHDVHTLGTQCGADGGCRVRGPAFYLEFHQACYLFSHSLGFVSLLAPRLRSARTVDLAFRLLFPLA